MRNPALLCLLMHTVLAGGRRDTVAQSFSLSKYGLSYVLISLSVCFLINANLKTKGKKIDLPLKFPSKV